MQHTVHSQGSNNIPELNISSYNNYNSALLLLLIDNKSTIPIPGLNNSAT